MNARAVGGGVRLPEHPRPDRGVRAPEGPSVQRCVVKMLQAIAGEKRVHRGRHRRIADVGGRARRQPVVGAGLGPAGTTAETSQVAVNNPRRRKPIRLLNFFIAIASSWARIGLRAVFDRFSGCRGDDRGAGGSVTRHTVRASSAPPTALQGQEACSLGCRSR